jgi:hypothetical protein
MVRRFRRREGGRCIGRLWALVISGMLPLAGPLPSRAQGTLAQDAAQ